MSATLTVPAPTALGGDLLHSIFQHASSSKSSPEQSAKSTSPTQQAASLSNEGSSLLRSGGQPLGSSNPQQNVVLEPMQSEPLPHRRANLIILQLSLITLLCSLASGLIVVGIPRIASDLALPAELYLWPSSVYGLTTGSVLLLAGAVADVVGSRHVELTACLLLGAFTLACGLSQTGIQLVVFRALQGVALAMHLPCSVSLIAHYVPSGKRRNLGFACTGLSMIFGFVTGLVLGGVLVDTIGWRFGFYFCGTIMLLQVPIGIRVFPTQDIPPGVWERVRQEVDWVGATIACAALSMFSYILATISTDSNNLKRPSSIAILTTSLILMVLFPIWMHFQTKNARPALIPNDLWSNLSFTCICLVIILTSGVGNSMEVFSSLYFQEVQELSALTASLHLVPAFVVGAVMSFSTGYFIDRAPVFWVVLIATCLSAGSPLLMALIDPKWPYWYGVFPAQILAPISGDILFTVGLIVVSEVFPEKTQGLAGAVYNTVTYFGWSLGINLMQVVSTLVTEGTKYRDKSSPAALLQGYRASYWAMFGATMACATIIMFGLRRLGRIGMKRE